MSEHVEIVLPWQLPRLSPNRRMHFRVRARETAAVRRDTGYLAIATFGWRRAEVTHPFTVQLHYRPARAGKRDPGNLGLDTKACIDGLIDAGLAPDDTPQYVTERMPKIHPVEAGQPGKLWLVISWETT